MKRVFFLVGFTVVSLSFFASSVFAADGFAEGVTGGQGGATVTVSNAVDFENYVESDEAYIVQVSGTIDLGSVGGKIHIHSNKTIRGIDLNPTIIGNIAFLSGTSNVIIERLNITNPDDWGEGDGITIKYATDIFVTKCTVYDCADGCIDISRESDYVTISWCKFYYTSAFDHRYVNLIGGSDGDTGDMGKLHITFHHNWWSTLCDQRMPSVRYGRLHIYNNYYDCPGNSYCVIARLYSECLIENNYFDHVNNPYYIYITSGEDGKIGASGNIFDSCAGYTDPGDDDVFTPPYSYTLDSASDVPSIVMAGAGAGIGPPTRLINPTDGTCGVSLDVILSWAAEPNADSYDLYFGTNFNDVNDATIDSAEYMGRYTANSYYLGELEEDTTYYWRIDDVNLSDPCSPYKGNVWSFTTVKVYYVDAEAAGNNDGSSWHDAFNHLQDALSVASSCDEIRVAEGVYKPDEDTAHPGGTGKRDATFELINGLAIYGGFLSGGGQWHERDPNAYETILSGDLMGNDGPNFANNGENSYHVVTSSGTSETAMLDGFIITAGNANGPEETAQNMGGGVLNLQSNSTLTNCIFIGNSAVYGGGMLSVYSNPALANCTFIGNSADYGGGMLSVYSNPMLANCTFSRNQADYGSGVLNLTSNPSLTNCTFSDNSAEVGSGICNSDSSPTLTNCTFSGNSAGQYGGGMYSEISSPTLTNCTFNGNSAVAGGGGILSYQSSPKITNCIFWADVPEEILSVDGTTIVTYSDVQGGWLGEGNIDTDPCFVNPDSNDYHLLPDSPCIDAGDPNSYFGLEPEPDGGRINMGAYGNTPEATCKGGLVLQSYNLVNKTRIDRTVFEYIYTMTLNNNSTEAVSNVIVELLDASANVTILDPDVSFAYIEAGESAVSDDTFSIIVDRSVPVDATIISWRATFNTAGGSGEGQVTFTTSIDLGDVASDIITDGVVDFADLAELAEQWLGPPGTPSADIAPQPDGDEIVNFLDFAKFAENWMDTREK